MLEMSALISFYSANLALINPSASHELEVLHICHKYFFFVKSSLAKYYERSIFQNCARFYSPIVA